jgi:predicted metal-dependent HD superfamily phosphohydrolase
MEFKSDIISLNMAKLSADYVKALFAVELPDWAVYHNIEHTLLTAETCIEMGRYYQLNSEDMDMLLTAAWFHDTGYIYGPEDHESKSSEIAEKFLRQNNCNYRSVGIITECIKKTKISLIPETLMHFIIRDADLISLGTQDFFRTDNLLKTEFELRKNITLDEREWLLRSEKFLNEHKYYTEYARIKLSHQLEINLKELRRRLNSL